MLAALIGKTSHMPEFKVKIAVVLSEIIKMERVDMVKRESVLVYASESSYTKGYLRSITMCYRLISHAVVSV